MENVPDAGGEGVAKEEETVEAKVQKLVQETTQRHTELIKCLKKQGDTENQE